MSSNKSDYQSQAYLRDFSSLYPTESTGKSIDPRESTIKSIQKAQRVLGMSRKDAVRHIMSKHLEGASTRAEYGDDDQRSMEQESAPQLTLEIQKVRWSMREFGVESPLSADGTATSLPWSGSLESETADLGVFEPPAESEGPEKTDPDATVRGGDNAVQTTRRCRHSPIEWQWLLPSAAPTSVTGGGGSAQSIPASTDCDGSTTDGFRSTRYTNSFQTAAVVVQGGQNPPVVSKR